MNRFNPHINIQRVVLVGLGGTGSQLARSLSRIVYDMRRRRHHIPDIYFVDPDTITEANIGRQMFTPNEQGQFKAEVLSTRFNKALGLSIVYYNEPFNAKKHTHSYGGNLILGAVDNHLARRALAEANGVWLDAGNHFSSGQVICGNTQNPELILRGIKTADYNYLPNAALLFPQLLQPETTSPSPTLPPTTSCAELIDLGEQHLLINDMIAGIAAEYLYKLLNSIPITSFITFFAAETLSMRSVSIDPDNLLPYLAASVA